MNTADTQEETCSECVTATTPLGIAKRLLQCADNIVGALATIDGIKDAGKSIKLSPAMIQSAECLNQRIFDNLLEAKSIMDSLLEDNFSIPTQ